MVVSTNPFEKYEQVKLDHLPKDRGENENYLKPPTSSSLFLSSGFHFLDLLSRVGPKPLLRSHSLYTLIFQFPIANISGNDRPLVPNIYRELEDQGNIASVKCMVGMPLSSWETRFSGANHIVCFRDLLSLPVLPFLIPTVQ